MEFTDGIWDELVLRIQTVDAIPRWVTRVLTSPVDRAGHASLDVTVITRSYLDFLTEQIELCARGTEWNDVLQHRLNGLQQYENVPLLQLNVHEGTEDFYLRARPDTLEIVYWEVC